MTPKLIKSDRESSSIPKFEFDLSSLAIFPSILSKKDAKGILVRNYKAKLMKISSLEETTSKKIDKRLASTKDHYHNKTIKNKEVWVRGTNKGVSKV